MFHIFTRMQSQLKVLKALGTQLKETRNAGSPLSTLRALTIHLTSEKTAREPGFAPQAHLCPWMKIHPNSKTCHPFHGSTAYRNYPQLTGRPSKPRNRL